MKVLLFSDTGIDDTIAIIYALYHPDIELKGIVEGYGNVERNKTLRNAHYLMKLAGKAHDIPVISGATGPLNGGAVQYFPQLHGKEGLGPIHPPIPAQYYRKQTNFDKIFEIIKANKDDITIVNAGRLTTLAMAYDLSPEVMDNVSEVYIMGGAFLIPGNVSPVAEANFYGDPLAANVVIEKAQNVSLTPLNVTNKAVITPEQVDLIAQRQTTAIGKIIKPILDFYIKAYQDMMPDIEGGILHDAVVMSAAVNPNAFLSYVHKKVQVVGGEGAAKGESIADFRVRTNKNPTGKKVRIAMKIDKDSFMRDLINVLSRSEIVSQEER